VRDVPLVPECDVLEADGRRGANNSREAADPLCDHGVALVRHRRRPFLTTAKRLLNFSDLGPRGDGSEGAFEPGEDQRSGVPDLECQRRVDDVGRRQPVVKPASRGSELLGDGVDEGRDVMMSLLLDLRDALGSGWHGRGTDLGDGLGRNDACLGPALERRELDLEPADELALVRPSPGHGRARVAGDHCRQSRGAGCGCLPDLQAPRMRTASTAAFFALSTPTAATGTPGGICTIERSASSPSATLSDERSGTPITGRSVCAATTPGSAAARPAPQIRTRSPRSLADRAYSATASGVRCAERTSNSCATPR